MDIGSIFLFLALLVLVALFVARPLVSPAGDEPLTRRASESEAEYERVLDAIAELDNDWTMGKVPKEIYRSQRQQLVAKGTTALRKLEAEPRSKPIKRTSKLTDAKLESLIAARRKARKK